MVTFLNQNDDSRAGALDEKQIDNEQPKEYTVSIVIVGEQHDSSRANKMMFAAQGVREIRTMMLGYKNNFRGIVPDYGVLIIFKNAYTSNQRSSVKKSIENYGGRYIEVSTLQELFSIMNNIKQYLYVFTTIDVKISSVSIYCHGVIGSISLGYGGNNQEILSLNSQNILNLHGSPYTSNAVFKSYACRTGLDENASHSDVIMSTPDHTNSLAQKIADHLGFDVYAYQRRTSYEDTWGSANHRQTFISNNNSENNIKAKVYDIFTRDPSDQKTWEAYHNTKIDVDGADWHEKGAYLGVKCGATPKGVSTRFEKYITRKLMFRQG